MLQQIESERLILRPVNDGDLQGIFALDSDPEVHRFLGKKPIQSLQEAKETIKYIQDQYKKEGIGRWAVIEKASDAFVGWAGLKWEQSVRQDLDYFDLGYRLRKKFWGRGFATEAARESLRYGFEMLNLNEIYAGAHIDNTASNKVLQKVGLQYIETFTFDNALHNWYGIKRSDWIESSIG